MIACVFGQIGSRWMRLLKGQPRSLGISPRKACPHDIWNYVEKLADNDTRYGDAALSATEPGSEADVR